MKQGFCFYKIHQSILTKVPQKQLKTIMSIIWTLAPKDENVDYLDLVVKIANEQDINLRDYNIGQVASVVQTFKDEIVDYILEHGLSALINSELLTEQVIPKGAAQNKIIQALHKYLDKVGVDNELLIIDPYFFAPTIDTTYPSTIELVIERYLPHVDTLYIVTLPGNKVDVALKSTIENKLKAKKATLNILHRTSHDYHDRFWISNQRKQGILTGTSLNGYGKKYSLVDRLNTCDVRDIVDSLLSSGLL